MKYIFIFIFIFLFFTSCSDLNTDIVLLSRPYVETNTISGGYLVEFQVYPEQTPRKIYLLYYLNHSDEYTKLDAKKVRDSIYQVEIPAQFYGNTIYYTIGGLDSQGVRVRYPKEGRLHFSIIRKNLNCELDSDCLTNEFCKKGSCSIFTNICETNEDCPTNYVCNLKDNQKCELPLKSCLTKSDCPDSFYCSNNSCISLGDSCDDSADCLLGESCKDNFCQMSDECQSDSDCSDELYCNNSYNLCLLKAQCESNSDCTSPNVCNQTIRQCVVKTCELHIDCPGENEMCDITTNSCVISDKVECHKDSDCSDDYNCDLSDLRCKECITTVDCNNGKVCIDNSCL